MSGIAELLVNFGYEVTGSDLSLSPITSRLESLGVKCAEGHAAGHVSGADLVVVSTAVRPTIPSGSRQPSSEFRLSRVARCSRS